MLRRLFFSQSQSPSPSSQFAKRLPVFNNADTVATIIDNITDLPTLCNFASVFPVARIVFAQYPRSILLHTATNDMVLAFVASTEYQIRGQYSIDQFLKQIINIGCPYISRLSNHSQVLGSLAVIDDAIENFSAFLLQRYERGDTIQSYKMHIKPGLVSYLWNLIWPRYYMVLYQAASGPSRAKEALWHLEIYNALFLTGRSAA